MRLKKLELFGFKSFAERTEITFTPGVTGVVGPNGSGKSNIADAVRWVLGEQSVKTLRGGKMEDVIFGGTQKRRPLTYTEVSLHLDNEDHYLAPDYTEIVITRRMFRDGESEYFINQTACRLKDVVSLFRDTGIGKEGYSIVGQGRIDEILSQKSEERRKVFEEAAGIANFKSRKEEASHKLKRTEDNLVRLEDRIEELERFVVPLEAQAEAARAYLLLYEELRELELNLFLVRHDRMSERITDFNRQLQETLVTITDRESRSAQAEEQLNTQKAAMDALEAELAELRRKQAEAVDAYHEEDSRLQRFGMEREVRENELKRLEAERERDEKALAALKALQVDREDGVARLGAISMEVKAEVQAAEAEWKTSVQITSDIEASLEHQKAALIDAMNRVSNLEASRQRQTAVRAQMESRLYGIEQDAAELRISVESTQAALLAAMEQETAASLKCRDLETQCAKIEEASQKVTVRVSEVADAIRENARERGSLESRLSTLQEMTRAYEGYQQPVRAALAYSEQAGIRGVHGVVARLLQVPEHLETAIDMALGSALQNIVTDNEETAKRLIEHLKKNGMGRVTLLPVSAIRSRTLNQDERRVLSMHGCLGVASELVDFSPEYRTVAEYLLGRTIIAESLDDGITIMREGRHAFRLVTPEGDVMHSGGSMTGGSVRQGAGRLLSRDREVKTLTQSVASKSGDSVALSAEAERLEAELSLLQEQREKALASAHAAEIDSAREQERVLAFEEGLQNTRARLEAVLLAAEQMRDGMAAIDEDLVRIESGRDSGQTDHQAMQSEAEALRLAAQEARLKQEGLREEYTQALLRLSKAEHDVSSALKNQQRYDSDEKDLQDKLARRADAITRLQEDITLALSEYQAGTLRTQASLTHRDLYKEKVDNAEANRRGEQEKLNTLRDEIDQLYRQSETDTDKRQRAELSLAKLEGELTLMRERIWDRYELTYAGAESFRRAGKFETGVSDKRAAQLREEINALGNVNPGAIEEYAETKERRDELAVQRDDLYKARSDLEKLIRQLDTQMEKQFISQFVRIQAYFKETFTKLFGGGQAELKLQDPNDALNCGIDVVAQPPGKRLQLLSLLSGGEKALCAIAILFAMLKLKATPFCLLDEIEAALDEANIDFFADFLTEYGRETQFIVVTHRKQTMERCDVLYGVTMEEKGVSKMVSVKLTDYTA